MGQKIKLFIDESGDFYSVGRHLITTISNIDDDYHSDLKSVEDGFSANNYNYRTFHATNISDKKKKTALKDYFLTFLNPRLNIHLTMAQLKKNSD